MLMPLTCVRRTTGIDFMSTIWQVFATYEVTIDDFLVQNIVTILSSTLATAAINAALLKIICSRCVHSKAKEIWTKMRSGLVPTAVGI